MGSSSGVLDGRPDLAIHAEGTDGINGGDVVDYGWKGEYDSYDQVMAGLHRFPGPAWDTVSRIARNVLAPSAQKPRVSAR
mgnify:CR=1 FL=1